MSAGSLSHAMCASCSSNMLYGWVAVIFQSWMIHVTNIMERGSTAMRNPFVRREARSVAHGELVTNGGICVLLMRKTRARSPKCERFLSGSHLMNGIRVPWGMTLGRRLRVVCNPVEQS